MKAPQDRVAACAYAARASARQPALPPARSHVTAHTPALNCPDVRVWYAAAAVEALSANHDAPALMHVSGACAFETGFAGNDPIQAKGLPLA